MKPAASNTTSSTSSSSKSALGKGLSSLIHAASPAGTNGAGEFLYLRPEEISPNPYQPRKEFETNALEDLAQSIREQGILQPLVVQKKPGGGYELIAGERRLRASKLAQIEKVPVILKTATDRGKLLMAIIENVQRSELNIVEEAKAYAQLMEEFDLSQEQVATKVGKSRSSVANVLRLLKLPSEILKALKEDKISFGHAKILLGLDNKKEQIAFFEQILEKNLSVRDLEESVKKYSLKDKEKGTEKDKEKEKLEKEIQKRLKLFKDNLESKTGFHFQLHWNLQGAGNIAIKFQSKEEFNHIYDYLLKSRN